MSNSIESQSYPCQCIYDHGDRSIRSFILSMSVSVYGRGLGNVLLNFFPSLGRDRFITSNSGGALPPDRFGTPSSRSALPPPYLEERSGRQK